MPVERSAGAVIFRQHGAEPHFLLLQYGAGHWDFPKGHIERGETTEATIRREIAEETELQDVTFVQGFKATIQYRFWKQKRPVLKFVVYWLAESRQGAVRLSTEHQQFVWLPFDLAREQITFETSRAVLDRAHQFLKAARSA